MRMLFNIVVICIATWIVTAEANISAVTVVKPTPYDCTTSLQASS